MVDHRAETKKTKYNSVITFKINKVSYPFPTCWPDVTYGQYLALLHSKTLTDQISIFTGIPRETLEKAELRNLEKISLALSFLSITHTGFNRTEMVGKYVMPLDITINSTGQFEDLRGLLMQIPKDISQEPERFADLCLHACAIYCQKLRDGKYDSTKVEEVKEELKDCSCAEVIGTGAFFLFRPANLSNPIMRDYLRLFRRLKNWIRAWWGYLRTLVLKQR